MVELERCQARNLAIRSTPTCKSGTLLCFYPPVDYVYLLRHGTRREFKIGRTCNPIHREGEIGIELPQRLEPTDVIETDDPAGIEGYWHRRFADKELKGEWFALDGDDVRAFRRWRRIF